MTMPKCKTCGSRDLWLLVSVDRKRRLARIQCGAWGCKSRAAVSPIDWCRYLVKKAKRTVRF